MLVLVLEKSLSPHRFDYDYEHEHDLVVTHVIYHINRELRYLSTLVILSESNQTGWRL